MGFLGDILNKRKNTGNIYDAPPAPPIQQSGLVPRTQNIYDTPSSAPEQPQQMSALDRWARQAQATPASPQPAPETPQEPNFIMPARSNDPTGLTEAQLDAPVYYRRGGMTEMPTARTVQRQEVTEGELAANKQMKDAQTALIESEANNLEAQAQWVAKKAEIQEKLVRVEEDSAARKASLERERQQAYESSYSQLTDLTNEYKNKENADFWGDRNFGQKLLAGIAVGLGAAGAAFSGGPNAAMQIINSRIQTNLAKQKADLEKTDRDIGLQRGILADTMAMFDNRVVAEDAARVAAYKKVDNELDALASRAQSDDMRNAIGTMKQQVQVQIAQADQTFQQSLRANVVQNYKTVVTPSKVFTLRDVMTEEAKKQGYVDYREMAKTPENMKRFVPAYGGFAYRAGDATELSKNAVDRSAARSILNKLIDFREKNKQWDKLNPGQIEYAKALHNELISLKKGKSMDDLGVLAGPDLELLLTSAPRPQDLFTFASDRYKATLDTLNNKERLDISGRIQPAKNIPSALQRNENFSTFESGVK